MSFSEALKKSKAGRVDRQALKLATAFVRGFFAAEPDRISAKSLAQQWREIGNFEKQPQHRLLRGYGLMIQHLIQSFHRSRARVLLQSPVTQLRWKHRSVEALVRQPSGSRQSFRARAAILALPLSAWQAPGDAAHHIEFDPQLNSKRDAASLLGFGSVVKVVMAFREPFWEEPNMAKAAKAKGLADAAYLHAAGAAFPTWWTTAPLHEPMLTAWAGGPDADGLAGRSEKALIATAIEELSDVLRTRSAKIKSMLIAAHACDWSAVPYIRGAYSHELVGGVGAGEQLASPIENTLFFAGEVTSGDQSATVAGAIESGRRAATELLRSL